MWPQENFRNTEQKPLAPSPDRFKDYTKKIKILPPKQIWGGGQIQEYLQGNNKPLLTERWL